MSRLNAFAVMGVGVALVLTACGGESIAPSACTDSIQFEGQQYAARAPVKRAATATATDTAIRGACSDVSPADGLSFPADGETVEVSPFKGLDESEVLGADATEGGFHAYLNVDLTEARAEKIMARLTTKERSG